MGTPQLRLGHGLEQVPRIYRMVALAAAGVLLVGLLIYGTASGGINRQLHAWKVLPEPERLTELYYDDHTHLPATYRTDTAQSFSFTIHNLEGRRTTYSYTISQAADTPDANTDSQNQAATVLARGSIDLTDNGYHSQPVTITPTDMGARSQIITFISFSSPTNPSEHHTQTLHYWVTKEGA